ncbi:hypothetical protein ACFPYI_09125 [Halomarina salina]|uniref:Uncharacterized protein n=1 Tax=Halomarina salina TaxID=1872699 RepID=A0ABD5RME3_9EURY|nr:hypothetical protein [Halomarina salina]
MENQRGWGETPPPDTYYVVALRSISMGTTRADAESQGYDYAQAPEWSKLGRTAQKQGEQAVRVTFEPGDLLPTEVGFGHWESFGDRMAALGEGPLFDRLDEPTIGERQAFRRDAEQAVRTARERLSAVYEQGDADDPSAIAKAVNSGDGDDGGD